MSDQWNVVKVLNRPDLQRSIILYASKLVFDLGTETIEVIVDLQDILKHHQKGFAYEDENEKKRLKGGLSILPHLEGIPQFGNELPEDTKKTYISVRYRNGSYPARSIFVESAKFESVMQRVIREEYGNDRNEFLQCGES